MSQRLTPLLILFLSLVLAGCSLTEEITFRSDFSGEASFRYRIVFEPGVDRDSLLRAHQELIDEVREAAGGVSGIHSVKYAFDPRTHSVELRFSFSGTEALNALYALDLFEELPFLRKSFSHKGPRRFLVEWPLHGLTEEDRSAIETDGGDLYAVNHYDLIINFPRAIRSSDAVMEGNLTELSEKQVRFKGTWKSFYSHRKPMQWRAKLR